MPDIDDLSNFTDGFSKGLHVNPLPASEVRRRGDRMRRRNTALATVGGVVAAAVFIGTPVALMNSGDDGRDIQPAPSTTISPETEPTWLTEIPAGFPLADAFPEANGLDGSPTEVVRGPRITPLDVCGTSWPAVEPVDAAGISYVGESEDRSSRVLVLLDDDAAAAASLDQLLSAAQACPNQPTSGGDSVLESRVIDLDLGTEQSVVVAQQIVFDDGSLADLTVTEVARSGNAIYIETSYGAAAGDQVIEFETARLKDRASTVLTSMCVFTADGC